MIFTERATVEVPGGVQYDMYGNEYPAPGKRIELVAPVVMQQRTTMEEQGGEWVHRVSDDCILISAPGWQLREITAHARVEVSGWTGVYEVEGDPVHYDNPVKHSEVHLKKVEG